MKPLVRTGVVLKGFTELSVSTENGVSVRTAGILVQTEEKAWTEESGTLSL